MALVTKNFSDIITFTRASTATFFDSAGVLQSAAIDAPRLDYDPSTLAAQGLLIEESRTNGIRNNTMQGASAGVSPTNWTASGTTANGITVNVQGAGLENGINYVDIEITGTATVTGTATAINFETLISIAALPSQVWSWSSYIKLISGSLTSLTLNGRVQWRTASTSISASDSSAITPTSFALATQRYSFAPTAPALTEFAVPQLRIGTVNGVTYNCVIRIGLPQLEQGAFATSVIPTTTAALTRAADVASVNTLSPWYNAAASTVYFEGTVATVSDSQTPYFWSISDNTKAFAAREQIAYARSPSSAQTVGLVAVGGVTNASVASSNTVVTANTVFKAAASYAANDVKVCVNGLTPATTASATLPTGLNTLKFGAPGWNGAPVANAFYMRRLTYYPRSFSGAELQALTV